MAREINNKAYERIKFDEVRGEKSLLYDDRPPITGVHKASMDRAKNLIAEAKKDREKWFFGDSNRGNRKPNRMLKLVEHFEKRVQWFQANAHFFSSGEIEVINDGISK